MHEVCTILSQPYALTASSPNSRESHHGQAAVDGLGARAIEGLHLPEVSSIAHVGTHLSRLWRHLGGRPIDLLTGLLVAQLQGWAGSTVVYFSCVYKGWYAAAATEPRSRTTVNCPLER